MKYCDTCFAINEDNEAVCIFCGAPLSSSSSKNCINRKRDRRIVWIGIAVLALAGLGFWIGKNAFSSRNKLENACMKTWDVVQEQVALDSQRQTVLEEAVSVLQSQNFSVSVSCRTSAQELCVNTDYSRKDRALNGTAYYCTPSDGTNLILNYSVVSDIAQISAPERSDSVYGCDVKTLGKILSNSKLASLLPVDIPKNFGRSVFKKTSIQDILKSYGGEHYEELVNSVECKKLADQELSVAGRMQKVSVYKVTWSSHAFTEFISHAWGSKLFSSIGQAVNSVIPEVEPDCLLYINKAGYLMGFDFVSMGTQYLFLLEGQEDPWEQFSLRVTSLYSDPVVYTGSKQVSDDKILMELKNEQEIFCSLVYNGSTSAFSLRTDRHGELLDGNLIHRGDTYGVTIMLTPEYGNPLELSCQISPLDYTPKALSKDYFDLLDMSLTDWQRMLLDMNIAK